MMCQSFLCWEVEMEFIVAYEAGIYRFLVRSTDPDVDYEEEFELSDINEAKMTVKELLEEIARPDEEFSEDVWGDPRED